MAGSPFFTGHAKSECSANRARDHEFLVGADDPYLDAGGIRRNQRSILPIALPVQFDAEKAESAADPLPDEWSVFADTSCEDERVQSTKRSCEGADPLFHLITKQRHGFRCPNSGCFTRAQVPQVRACPGNSEQPGLVVHHLLKLRRSHALGALCRIAPRERQQFGDPRHLAVKRRVEARNLGQG